MTDRLNPTPPHPSCLIVKGPQAEIDVPLDEPSLTLGSSMEADIVLRDVGLAPIHIRFERESDRMQLHAVGADATIVRHDFADEPEHRSTLEPGSGTRLLDGCTVVIGDTALLFRWGGAEGRSLPPHRSLVVAPSRLPRTLPTDEPERRVPLAVLLLPALAMLTALVLEWGEPVSVPEPVRRAAAMPIPPQRPSEPRAVDGTGVRVAHEALDQQLAARGIRSVELSVEGDVIVADGRMSSEADGDWQAIQRWFDEAHGRDATLVSQVQQSGGDSALPPPSVEAVWLGDEPYIVSRGRRYRPGDRLGDGWRIVEIVQAHVVLRHGGREVRVLF